MGGGGGGGKEGEGMPCKRSVDEGKQRQLSGIYFLYAAKHRETERLEKIVPRPTRYCIPRAAENGGDGPGRAGPGLTSSRRQMTRRRASAFLRGDVREIKLDQPSAPPTSPTRKAKRGGRGARPALSCPPGSGTARRVTLTN